MVTKKQEKLHHSGTDYQFESEIIQLGPWSSYSLLHDPKHMCFVLSRYKFCAKMLEGKRSVLEIGCGDGLGAPIVAQSVKSLYCIDWDERLIKNNMGRLSNIKNIEFHTLDITEKVLNKKFAGIFSIDVIEHLDPKVEKKFMQNSCKSLTDDGVCIIGTPNITAEKYATHRSSVQHINLKSHTTLRKLLSRYFRNVFIFSMNDEVVHTGFYPMAHYLFGVGVGLK
ncbi:TPA: class I SAM-dependent methyltransferase [archaeon]|uniref:Class I SAM-dependent methyltransferase n=1 Tax=Candidatus Naiadarchaeum limnaeum TaxID=2756139 RepID=A0A832V9R6_9ARCH|nr:class I SAM-dependent methyltransferase [Candidatus Naiadarchaeum limnaeum]